VIGDTIGESVPSTTLSDMMFDSDVGRGAEIRRQPRNAFIKGTRTMIKFRGERRKLKVARTRVPKSAKFRLLKSVLDEGGKAELDLVAAATKAFGDAVDAHPDSNKKGIHPDDFYDRALDGAKIRERWENMFGGKDVGRELFSLVAWQYFFDHKSTWFATASDAAGLGKRDCTYVREDEPDASSLVAAEDSRNDAAPGRNVLVDPLNGPPQSGIVPPTNAVGTASRATTFDRSNFPAVNSEAWDVMNRRRGDLIQKKNRDGLTNAEQLEYDQLQELSLQAVEEAFPRPVSLMVRLAELRASLNAESEYHRG
jgi:hypothetical protein